MIITDENYSAALDRLTFLWDNELSLVEKEEFEDLAYSLSEYENKTYPIISNKSVSYMSLYKDKNENHT